MSAVHVRYMLPIEWPREISVAVYDEGTVRDIAKALRDKATKDGHDVSEGMGGDWTGDDRPRALWWTESLTLDGSDKVYVWHHMVTREHEKWTP